jgi:hypothetical protein
LPPGDLEQAAKPVLLLCHEPHRCSKTEGTSIGEATSNESLQISQHYEEGITLCVNPSLAPGRSVHSEVKTVPSEETRRLRERAR